MPGQLVRPITAMMLISDGPMNASTARIRKKVGKHIMISIKREITISTQPPK
ncbi:hypothetical protein D3C83_255290 [compost metagenome]